MNNEVPRDISMIISVDYGNTLGELIDNGCYDECWAEEVKRGFRLTRRNGQRSYEVKLVASGWRVSSIDAVHRIVNTDGNKKWRPAKIEHLLAFGQKFPEKQRELTIVALGSVGTIDSVRLVPCLDGDSTKRRLRTAKWDWGWSLHNSFLAIRNL